MFTIVERFNRDRRKAPRAPNKGITARHHHGQELHVRFLVRGFHIACIVVPWVVDKKKSSATVAHTDKKKNGCVPWPELVLL